MKLLPYILYEKYINILASETASPGNLHRASCMAALSFTVVKLKGRILEYTCLELYRPNCLSSAAANQDRQHQVQS